MLNAVPARSQVCLALFGLGHHKKDLKETAKLKILTQLLLSTEKKSTIGNEF